MDTTSEGDVDDRDLMLEVQDGRTAALGELFERNHGRLYRFCLRMTGNGQQAEDIVQDVFMRMLRYRQSYRKNREFSPWMYQLARNACMDSLKKSPQRTQSLELPDELEFDAPIASELWEQEESVGLLRQALLRLPVHRREVLVLSRYEFRSYDEIATLLDCSVGAVKVRVHRAISHLRRIYSELANEVSL